MTKALDYFDPASEYNNDLVAALKRAKAKFLVISFTSDWRFAPERSKEIVKALIDAKRQVSYGEVEASGGHDAFLMPIEYYMQLLRSYMDEIDEEVRG
jgi:homoserine O-acetyltransferase